MPVQKQVAGCRAHVTVTMENVFQKRLRLLALSLLALACTFAPRANAQHAQMPSFVRPSSSSYPSGLDSPQQAPGAGPASNGSIRLGPPRMQDAVPPWGGSAVVPGEPNYSQINSQPVELDPPFLQSGTPWVPDAANLPNAEPPLPPGVRDGIWQKVRFESVWMARGSGADGLGMNHLRLASYFAFPMLTRRSPLIVTPSFGVHYFNGPDAPDVPARVYGTALDFRWLRPISKNWAAEIGAAPGIYSDFELNNSDALRITGRGLVQYTGPNEARWVAGVAYLDRQDVKILPVGGVIWAPSDGTLIELILPRPRVARRVVCGGAADWWGYVGGEFGGGAWAIQRTSGAADELTYRDFRVKLGVERKSIGGVTGHVEVGYVFGRKLEYRSGTPDFRPDDTVMVRSGWAY